MLQIHNIFNLVATLYETRLLQPEISIWVMNALPNKPSDKLFPCVYFAAYGYLPGFRPCNSITPGTPVSSLRLVRYCLSRHVNCVTQLLKLQAEWQIPWISCRIFPWFTYAFLSSSNNNYHQCTYQPCRKLLRNYLFLPYLGQKPFISHYLNDITIITLYLGSASVSCNNNDIILVMGYD